ncbi:MAG TPA: LPP20 family lipoprotein [Bacteroidota bacterium]|nr:LPP20 family lipoprotein [Bacteroidota bacterium]
MRLRALICAMLFSSVSFGQTFQDNPNSYYIGRGQDASIDVARARAYANMVEQIQVIVSSSLRTATSEKNSSMQNSADQTTLSFSSIMLRDVQEDVQQGQGVVRVTKYVMRSTVRSIFEQRRRQILDELRAAEAEADGTAGVDVQRMLGHYYAAWLATALYPDTLTYAFRFGGMSTVAAGIPMAMQRVCDRIRFIPDRKIDDEYTTWKYRVSWSERPVTHMRFTFHDGLGESEEEIRDGAVQATFLFADKRERRFPAAIEYHTSEFHDPLLAIADSIRSPFAPRMTVEVLLPGETRTAVADTVASGAGRATKIQQSLTDAGTVQDGRRDTAQKKTALAMPRALQVLDAKKNDLAFVKSEMIRLGKRGDLIAGKKDDFESLDGLYVIVLDEQGIRAMLLYDRNTYTNIATGEPVQLPDYAGKRILWVKVQ